MYGGTFVFKWGFNLPRSSSASACMEKVVAVENNNVVMNVIRRKLSIAEERSGTPFGIILFTGIGFLFIIFQKLGGKMRQNDTKLHSNRQTSCTEST